MTLRHNSFHGVAMLRGCRGEVAQENFAIVSLSKRKKISRKKNRYMTSMEKRGLEIFQKIDTPGDLGFGRSNHSICSKKPIHPLMHTLHKAE